MQVECTGTNALLDAIANKMGLKNDAALSRALDVAPPVVSKLRHGRLPLGPAMILGLIEDEIMTLAEIRAFVPRAA